MRPRIVLRALAGVSLAALIACGGGGAADTPAVGPCSPPAGGSISPPPPPPPGQHEFVFQDQTDFLYYSAGQALRIPVGKPSRTLAVVVEDSSGTPISTQITVQTLGASTCYSVLPEQPPPGSPQEYQIIPSQNAACACTTGTLQFTDSAGETATLTLQFFTPS